MERPCHCKHDMPRHATTAHAARIALTESSESSSANFDWANLAPFLESFVRPVRRKQRPKPLSSTHPRLLRGPAPSPLTEVLSAFTLSLSCCCCIKKVHVNSVFMFHFLLRWNWSRKSRISEMSGPALANKLSPPGQLCDRINST